MQHFRVAKRNFHARIRNTDLVVLLEEVERLAMHGLKAESFLEVQLFVKQLAVNADLSPRLAVNFIAFLMVGDISCFERPMTVVGPQAAQRTDRAAVPNRYPGSETPRRWPPEGRSRHPCRIA